MDMSDDSPEAGGNDRGTFTRRNLLKTAPVGAVGLAGLASTSGSVSANHRSDGIYNVVDLGTSEAEGSWFGHRMYVTVVSLSDPRNRPEWDYAVQGVQEGLELLHEKLSGQSWWGGYSLDKYYVDTDLHMAGPDLQQECVTPDDRVEHFRQILEELGWNDSSQCYHFITGCLRSPRSGGGTAWTYSDPPHVTSASTSTYPEGRPRIRSFHQMLHKFIDNGVALDMTNGIDDPYWAKHSLGTVEGSSDSWWGSGERTVMADVYSQYAQNEPCAASNGGQAPSQIRISDCTLDALQQSAQQA